MVIVRQLCALHGCVLYSRPEGSAGRACLGTLCISQLSKRKASGNYIIASLGPWFFLKEKCENLFLISFASDTISVFRCFSSACENVPVSLEREASASDC